MLRASCLLERRRGDQGDGLCDGCSSSVGGAGEGAEGGPHRRGCHLKVQGANSLDVTMLAVKGVWGFAAGAETWPSAGVLEWQEGAKQLILC